jgi:hypothetical protein
VRGFEAAGICRACGVMARRPGLGAALPGLGAAIPEQAEAGSLSETLYLGASATHWLGRGQILV